MDEFNKLYPTKYVFGTLLVKLNIQIRRDINQILSRFNLTYIEFIILMLIKESNSISEIVEIIGLDQTLISRYTKKLVDRNFVCSEVTFEDGRHKLFYISPDFETIFQEIECKIDNYYKQFGQFLTANEYYQISSLITELTKRLVNINKP